MSAKKPLVLDANGDFQQLQTGDTVDVSMIAGAATSTSLTSEVNRATSAEATIAAAAAAAQTTANAAVPQTTTVNGHALNANVTVTKADVGLGNVDNTSDVNKPVSTAQATAIGLKADQATTYTKTETDTRIQAVVGAAPAALDTLVEIANQLASDESAVASLVTTVSTKAASADLTTETNARIAADATLVPKTTTVNGHALSGNVTVSKADVGLGNVDNTSDATKSIGGNAATATVASSLNGPSIAPLTNNEVTTVVAGAPVYTDTSGTFKKAVGSSAAAALVVGLAAANINASTQGNIAVSDILTLTTGQWDAVTGQTGGLTAGVNYFLDPATAGKITSTVPTTGFLVIVGQALSSTVMLVRIGNGVQL